MEFANSIGKKELVKSIDIYDSLIQNGNNVTLINIYMFSLFEAIYNYKSRFNESPFNFALNKIIKNRINNYALKFNIKEIERIILKINENDYLIKSTNLDIITLSKCMISNICKDTMNDISDELLIKDFQKGNIKSYNQLVYRYKDRLFNAFINLCMTLI